MANIIKVDFTRKWSQQLNVLIEEQIAKNVFPGIEIFFAIGEETCLHQTWGAIEVGNGSSKLQANTIFDIASITKPLATATTVMILQERGLLDLEEPAATFIPELRKEETAQVTLRQLLTHTSGLPAWEGLYQQNDKITAWEQLIKIPLQYPTGKNVIYSCLGYLILGEVIRRVTGQKFADFYHENIAVPLKMNNTSFSPWKSVSDLSQIAPTQYCPFRKKLLRGIVHDENSFVFDEEGGNAGLFSTVTDLFRFCKMVLNGGELDGVRVLSKYSIQTMMNNHNPKDMLPRGLGWEKKESGFGYWSCGTLFPDGAIGHNGFTGTSLWLDPVSQIIVIVLTNRVHISREANLEKMRIFRPRLHNLLLSMF